MNFKTRKRISFVLAIVCCLSLLVGTFAFFTDTAEADASANAGNINMVFSDTSLAAEGKVYEVVDGNLTEVTNAAATVDNQQVDGVWDSNTGMLVQDGVLNPGDTVDMDYKLANTGSKSIDVRQKITVTVTDKAGNPLALTEKTTDAGDYQYNMTNSAAGWTLDDSKAAQGILVYTMDDITLQGTVEKDGTDDEAEFEASLAFVRESLNAYMDSNVEVVLEAWAKQHRNTSDADWVQIATYETVA